MCRLLVYALKHASRQARGRDINGNLARQPDRQHAPADTPGVQTLVDMHSLNLQVGPQPCTSDAK
jgi:hypothetical protein